MPQTEATNHAIKKVAEPIKDIKLAMMTIVDADGNLP